MRNSIPENLAEHSAQTAVLAHALAVIGNKFYNKNYDIAEVTLTALYHDVPEVFTGDLPTPVKYFGEGMRDNCREIERCASEKLLSKLPEELRDSYRNIVIHTDEEMYRIVKAADKLCAYIKCVEEEKSGNAEFGKAGSSTLASLKEMKLPELDYFMEKLLPSFSLTLDEM